MKFEFSILALSWTTTASWIGVIIAYNAYNNNAYNNTASSGSAGL